MLPVRSPDGRKFMRILCGQAEAKRVMPLPAMNAGDLFALPNRILIKL